MRKIGLLLGTLFLLAGCSFCRCKPIVRYIQKPVYIKCQIPEVPRAELDPIPENATYPRKLQIILNNYFKLEKENKMLREAIEVCK
jgi:hypothetical protein